MGTYALLFACAAMGAADVLADSMTVAVETSRVLNHLPTTFVSFGWEMDQMRRQVNLLIVNLLIVNVLSAFSKSMFSLSLSSIVLFPCVCVCVCVHIPPPKCMRWWPWVLDYRIIVIHGTLSTPNGHAFATESWGRKMAHSLCQSTRQQCRSLRPCH